MYSSYSWVRMRILIELLMEPWKGVLSAFKLELLTIGVRFLIRAVTHSGLIQRKWARFTARVGISGAY